MAGIAGTQMTAVRQYRAEIDLTKSTGINSLVIS